MAAFRPVLAGALIVGLGGCTTLAAPSGTPEFAAAKVSRGYDCGLRVDRAGIMSRLPPAERARFLVASRGLAVKSYKAPLNCDAGERQAVQRALAALSRR